MDIATAVGAAKLWLKVAPIRRVKSWRQRRRAKKSGEQTSEKLDIETTEEPKMKGMAIEVFSALVRHGLTIGGGAGLLSDSEAEQAAAAIATLAGLVWSIVRKLRDRPRASA